MIARGEAGGAAVHQRLGVRWRRLRRSAGLLHVVLILPALLVVIGVIGYPWLYSVWISLNQTNVITHRTVFVGLQNYLDVLHDPELLASLWRTVWFSILSVVGTTGAGLAMALVLNERFRGRTVVRTLVLLPWAVAPVVVGQIFQLLYNGNYGTLNGFLYQLGQIHSYIPFLADGQRALVLVAVASVWSGAPLTALLLLASLQSIPGTLYRAALVDGAGVLTRFLRITLPSLRSMLLLVVIVNTINALLAFDLIFVLTKGGPGDSTTVLSWWGYTTSFQYGRYNDGSAILYVLSVISLVSAVAYYLVLRERRSRRRAQAAAPDLRGLSAEVTVAHGRLGTRPRRFSRRWAKAARRVVLGIAVALVVLWTVVPFYAAINASFTPEVSFLSRPPRLFPWPIYLGNYQAALFGSGSSGSGGGQAMLVAMRNSLIVSSAVTALNVVIGALAGYAFARSRGNGVVSGTLWLLMLTRMIPGLSLLVPFFLLFQSFGLVDSLPGLVVAYTSFILPLVAWILKSYFETVPVSLERAALVDGCTRIGALIRVVVPVGLPGIVAAAIFAFIVSWNLFVYPAVLATSADTQTLPVAIASFISDQRVWNPAIVYAAGMFALIPPVVISIVLQRYVIRGLTAGAVKG